MAFIFSEKHISDFHTLGCTIFRAIVPPRLIDDCPCLRRNPLKWRKYPEKAGPVRIWRGSRIPFSFPFSISFSWVSTPALIGGR